MVTCFRMQFNGCLPFPVAQPHSPTSISWDTLPINVLLLGKSKRCFHFTVKKNKARMWITLGECYNKLNQNMPFVKQNSNLFLSIQQLRERGQTLLQEVIMWTQTTGGAFSSSVCGSISIIPSQQEQEGASMKWQFSSLQLAVHWWEFGHLGHMQLRGRLGDVVPLGSHMPNKKRIN